MKYLYKDFTLDFDKVNNQIIAEAVSKLFYEYKTEVDYVWWNPLGTYIMWNDGGGAAYYFTKNYLRISGWDLHDKEDIQKCLEYLRLKTTTQ